MGKAHQDLSYFCHQIIFLEYHQTFYQFSKNKNRGIVGITSKNNSKKNNDYRKGGFSIRPR
jgi:hypothetical protein